MLVGPEARLAGTTGSSALQLQLAAALAAFFKLPAVCIHLVPLAWQAWQVHLPAVGAHSKWHLAFFF